MSTKLKKGKNNILHFGPASLRYAGNMPILFLIGTSHERGTQYGALLSDLLRRGVDLRYHELFHVMNVPKKVILPEITKITENNNAQFDEDMLQFLHGMVDGTNKKVSYEEIYACNSMIMFLEPGGCSAFTKILTDGAFIYCHQTDFSTKEIYYDNWVTIIEENEKGERMASNIVIGGIGAQNGMNDRGICIGGASRYPITPENSKPEPFPLAPFYNSRLCLQKANNLEEAINIIPDETLIASGFEQKSAMCEKTVRYQDLKYSKDGFLFGTNSYVNENCMEDEGSITGSSYNGKIQCARYLRYAEILDKCHSIADAASILRDNVHYYTGIRSWGCVFSPMINIIGKEPIDFVKNIDKPRALLPLADRTICNNLTLHSMICVPENSLIYVNSGGTYCAHNEYVGININGEVDDEWNINGPKIPASPDVEKARNFLKFFMEMTAADYKASSSINICRKYAAIHPEVPSYQISLALWLQNKDPIESLELATKLLKEYPGHYDLVRLVPRIRFSLLEKNEDTTLLDANVKELRPYLNKKKEHHDIFIADIEYLLIKSLALGGKIEEARKVYSDLEEFLMAEKYAKNKPQYLIILEKAKQLIS